jgi:predicted dehydrogenase
MSIPDEQIQKMKELIKQGRKSGKVLHFSKAFEMYPTEEEVHKGESEYWTRGENQDEMRDR